MKTINLNTLKLILALTSLIFFSSISANNEAIQPFKKGSFQQIQQAHKNTPYIISFWSETCGYCMKELTLLGQLLPKYPEVKLVTISTDAFLDKSTVNRILSPKKLQDTEKWVFADNYVERLYFDIDKKWRGELPLTYLFDRNGKMIKHLGVINEKELVEWFDKQKISNK